MNVLFLARLYWPHVGGVEKHVYEISQRLKVKGQNIIIVTGKYDSKLPSYEIHDGVGVHRIPANSKWQVWKWMIGHFNLLIWADIIHIHDVFYWYLPFIWYKKSFITFHGYEGSDPPNIRQVFWHRLAAKLTRGNICIGDFHRKWYGVRPTLISYGAV